jgi:alkanesulfonate monooxygenase SsuD/methylene tetrahydromethanopterin reductase-like flavin-dependent oxidoreductase (luciferase family)
MIDAPTGHAGDRAEVGLVLLPEVFHRWGEHLGELTAAISQAGIGHVTVGDHVSFAGGNGVDGLIQATALLAAHPSLRVCTGVYLLALRHPAIVARQLVTIAMFAPGRLIFGVAVGGDDPRELELCGVDPRTRGMRMDEALALIRRQLTGETTTAEGRFYPVRAATIRPAPAVPITVLVGGRADAAIARAGALGDGWLELWVSPRRVKAGVAIAETASERAGRSPRELQHSLELWAAFGETREAATARITPLFERYYGLPFERFARYTPCGRPADIADALSPYVNVGCRRFTIVPEARDFPAAITGVAELSRMLNPGRVPAAG